MTYGNYSNHLPSANIDSRLLAALPRDELERRFLMLADCAAEGAALATITHRANKGAFRTGLFAGVALATLVATLAHFLF